LNYSDWDRYIILKFFVWIREFTKVCEILYDYEDELKRQENICKFCKLEIKKKDTIKTCTCTISIPVLYLTPRTKRLLKNKVNSWINKWTLNSNTVDKNLSPELIEGLKDTVIDNNYTIYRGLTWGKDEMSNFDKIDINKLKVNNNITMDLKTMSSWSTNYEVAYIYSKYKVISRKNDYGLILKLNIDKSNVIADLRHNDEGEVNVYGDGDDEPLIVQNQSEIILAPGKYECEIILIRILDYEIKK
jgi:hypothetical protein